ncbi:MAG: sulfatase, partial [Flavipsychrobacter sp.]|nr:sulfatase [Flavipsychrobacter sp.]
KRISLQLLLLLVLYTISRVVFTSMNLDKLGELSGKEFASAALHGLRFDLSAIFALNALYLVLVFLPFGLLRYKWWRTMLNVIFIAINLLAFAFELSDWAYFSFTNKRATADVLDMISRKGDFLVLLPHFAVDYWYVFAAFVLVATGFVWLNYRIRKRYPVAAIPPGLKKFVPKLVLFLLVVGASILGIRGGWQNAPLNIGFALEAADSDHVPIVLNTPFSILNTLSNKKLPELNYYSEEELQRYFKPVKQYGGKPFRPKNVVIVILESFSKNYTGIGGYQSFTPFLDSLMQHSFVCRNAYANALHSAEGIPAIVAGIPSLMNEPITSSIYSTNKITALPALLKEKGYSSAFYHGATNGTMNFDVFCYNAGFDKYYGRTEYNNENDYDGSWGIWDEPYLKYFATSLNQTKQPFLASVFTLSSHDPYKVPKEYKNVLPKGDMPAQQSVAYTDMALRKFFAIASQQPYFNNTLFVFTADHCSLQTIDDHDHGNMGFYRIPVFFYAPGDSSMKGGTDELMQQVDILPSVLDYLGYEKPFFTFGRSIFRNEEKRFVLTEHIGTYQMAIDSFIYKTKGEKTTDIYNFSRDRFCHNNLLNQSEGKMLQAQFEPYLKAYKQLYHSALIKNKMHADKYGDIAD